MNYSLYNWQDQIKRFLGKVSKSVQRCQGERVNLLGNISLNILSPPLLCLLLLNQNEI